MSFYSSDTIKKIKSLETSPRVYKGIFTQNEIQKLIDFETQSELNRMVDRSDSRKTKIDWKSFVSDIITPKLERILSDNICIGDFPAHFIKNRFPLRTHADMGKDPELIPYKNILIPLFVKGNPTTYTILFKQKWYGQSSLFGVDAHTDSDHSFKDINGNFIHVKDSHRLLKTMEENKNTKIKYNEGIFLCTDAAINKIRALLNQSRYSVRTNKHITSDKPFNIEHYNKFLTHQPYEDLQSLEIDRAIAWYPGDVIVFNRSTIHCASNFLAEGVQEKMAIALFTVWDA